LETLGIEENSLHFKPILHKEAATGEPVSSDNVLADIKRQVGRVFNVPGSAVEIVIRL
jgi:hypothetical protein